MKKVTLSLTILAFAASSMTLWLLESPLKPMLYFFEAALTLTMYHSLETSRKHGLKLKERQILNSAAHF